MLTAKTLKYLAAVTAVLFAASAAIGDDRDILYIIDDLVWYGFLVCALTLIVLTVGVLLRSRKGSAQPSS
jgi:hypothetical protein